ncbi:hypothetical protein C4J81_02675 [Deltaproteobacteria bacterium Smac51]|nr:hypothetical protein C4J81_02675 [Deltaproteobacteria bacterium Smac51]
MNVERTVCFSGGRPEDFSALSDGHAAYAKLTMRIKSEILRAAGEGFTHFMCGMEEGFDLMCGGVFLELKKNREHCTDLRLVAVPPYRGHHYSGYWGRLHALIMVRADEVITLNKHFTASAHYLRSRYLVENSARVICYHEEQADSGDFIINYAQEKDLDIVNLKKD